jgi:hypothetical protein
MHDFPPVLTADVAKQWLETGDVPDCDTIENNYFGLGDILDTKSLFTQTAHDYAIRAEIITSAYTARRTFISQISFAIPCKEALDTIRINSPSLIEIGAGTGYWSALLARAGVDTLACDTAQQVSRFGQSIGAYHPVAHLSAGRFIKLNPGRDVLMAWPDHSATWSARLADKMHCNRLLYLIGEGRGGCTGCDELFEVLDADFEEVADIQIPQWEGIHDRLTVHRKVKGKQANG